MFRLEKLASKPQDVRRRSIYQHESVLEVSHVASDEFPFMKFSLSCKVFHRQSERKNENGDAVQVISRFDENKAVACRV